MPRRGPVVRAEYDDVRLLLLGQPAQPLRGRRAHDDAGLDTKAREPIGAPLEQHLGVVLLALLLGAVAVRAVAHIGQRQVGAGVGEDASKHQRVVIAWRVVVGDERSG